MMNIGEEIQLISNLQQWGEIDDTELGELTRSLCQIAHRHDYTSDEFHCALIKEITDHLTNYQENATIVEVVESRPHTVRFLEWS